MRRGQLVKTEGEGGKRRGGQSIVCPTGGERFRFEELARQGGRVRRLTRGGMELKVEKICLLFSGIGTFWKGRLGWKR